MTDGLTPIEWYGSWWAKRDDLYRAPGGAPGGKARTCWALAQGAPGLVTAGSRSSPQVAIVASIAQELGIPCRVHTPAGDPGAEVLAALAAGAERIEHRSGYNNVIVAGARRDAERSGWRLIPFGMECQEAIDQTSAQVAAIPAGVRRIVVPVGSGMSLAGILAADIDIPILGVWVGADPHERLDRWAPLWRMRAVELARSPYDYRMAASPDWLPNGVRLDPIYEAKVLPYLLPRDLFWVVGIRPSAVSS